MITLELDFDAIFVHFWRASAVTSDMERKIEVKKSMRAAKRIVRGN